MSTDYGRVLLIKLFLVVLILLIAAVNWRRCCRLWQTLPTRRNLPQVGETLPALGFGRSDVGYRCAGFRGSFDEPSSATALANVGPVALSKRNEDVTVNLHLDSTQVGTIHSSVILQDSSGRTISGAKRVTFFVRMLDMDMGLETIEAQPMPGGHRIRRIFHFLWRADGRSAWRFRLSQGDKFVTEFNVSTGSSLKRKFSDGGQMGEIDMNVLSFRTIPYLWLESELPFWLAHAWAHVTFKPNQPFEAGGSADITMVVPTERAVATVRVTLELPEGFLKAGGRLSRLDFPAG